MPSWRSAGTARRCPAESTVVRLGRSPAGDGEAAAHAGGTVGRAERNVTTVPAASTATPVGPGDQQLAGDQLRPRAHADLVSSVSSEAAAALERRRRRPARGRTCRR